MSCFFPLLHSYSTGNILIFYVYIILQDYITNCSERPHAQKKKECWETHIWCVSANAITILRRKCVISLKFCGILRAEVLPKDEHFGQIHPFVTLSQNNNFAQDIPLKPCEGCHEIFKSILNEWITPIDFINPEFCISNAIYEVKSCSLLQLY